MVAPRPPRNSIPSREAPISEKCCFAGLFKIPRGPRDPPGLPRFFDDRPRATFTLRSTRSPMKRPSLPRVAQRLHRCRTATLLFVLTISLAALASAKTPLRSTAKAQSHDSKEVKVRTDSAFACVPSRAPVPQFEPCYRFMWRYR